MEAGRPNTRPASLPETAVPLLFFLHQFFERITEKTGADFSHAISGYGSESPDLLGVILVKRDGERCHLAAVPVFLLVGLAVVPGKVCTGHHSVLRFRAARMN